MVGAAPDLRYAPAFRGTKLQLGRPAKNRETESAPQGTFPNTRADSVFCAIDPRYSGGGGLVWAAIHGPEQLLRTGLDAESLVCEGI